MKHNIGDKVFWVYSSCYSRKEVECPVCFGELFVTILLGNGEETKSECGYCKKGYGGPTGKASVWEPSALVRDGEITGITTRSGLRYEVGHETIDAHEVFTNKNIAEIERDKRFEEEKERAAKRFEESFVNCKESQLWSVGYHKSEIERAQRSIEWHELRLGKIKERRDK